MEKENYIIIENRPELSKEEILKGRDFDQVLRISKTAKALSLGKGLLIGAVVGLIAVIAFVFISDKNKPVEIKENTPKKDTVILSKETPKDEKVRIAEKEVPNDVKIKRDSVKHIETKTVTAVT